MTRVTLSKLKNLNMSAMHTTSHTALNRKDYLEGRTVATIQLGIGPPNGKDYSKAMAQIILTNGQTLDVTHNQAAKIYAILQGNSEPEDEEQAAFLETVANVKFNSLPTRTVVTTPGQKDEELQQLMYQQFSSGYARFQAIGQHIKDKHRTSED